MPHPLYLQVMGVSISEYNSYTPAKKARFQTAAQKKLAEVSADSAAYNDLTERTAKAVAIAASEAADDEFQDEERS